MIVHSILLGLLTIANGIGTVAFFIAFYNDTYTTASGLVHSQPKWLAGAVTCLGLFVGGLIWWTSSANEPWTTALVTTHEIKMFTCDGKHYNITVLFGKIVEPKEWIVERVRWNPYYSGVSYSACDRCINDKFNLSRVDDTASHELAEEPNK